MKIRPYYNSSQNLQMLTYFTRKKTKTKNEILTVTTRFFMTYQSHAHTLSLHSSHTWSPCGSWGLTGLALALELLPWSDPVSEVLFPKLTTRLNLSILQVSVQMSLFRIPTVLFATTSDPKSVCLLLNQTSVHLPKCNKALGTGF